MFDVIAAVNDHKVLRQNLLRSPLLRLPGVSFQARKGHRSAASAYNSAIGAAGNELIVCAHQDVYIPKSWVERIQAQVAELDATDPSWAILGLYGVTRDCTRVGYVWSSGLDSVVGQPFVHPATVDSVDELLIVIRRSSGVRFDNDLPGFHLYGTDIVQTAWTAGRSAYVVCAPVIHNSRPVLYLSADYLRAHDYMRRKWKYRLPIQNCIAPIVDSRATRFRQQARYWINAFRHRNIDRQKLDRNYDSVEIAKRLGMEDLQCR